MIEKSDLTDNEKENPKTMSRLMVRGRVITLPAPPHGELERI